MAERARCLVWQVGFFVCLFIYSKLAELFDEPRFLELARAIDGGFVLNGAGAGQMSRVDSVRLAISKATREVPGSVLASDAFFPFPDGVEIALEAGVTALIQPGGSIRDEAVLAAVDGAGASMVFTGMRHFRH